MSTVGVKSVIIALVECGSKTRTTEVRCFGERWAYRIAMVGDVCPRRLLTVPRVSPT